MYYKERGAVGPKFNWCFVAVRCVGHKFRFQAKRTYPQKSLATPLKGNKKKKIDLAKTKMLTVSWKNKLNCFCLTALVFVRRHRTQTKALQYTRADTNRPTNLYSQKVPYM